MKVRYISIDTNVLPLSITKTEKENNRRKKYIYEKKTNRTNNEENKREIYKWIINTIEREIHS